VAREELDASEMETQRFGSNCGQFGLALCDLNCDFNNPLSPGMHITELYDADSEFPTPDVLSSCDV
jgi:hypothetical protein